MQIALKIIDNVFFEVRYSYLITYLAEETSCRRDFTIKGSGLSLL